MSASFETGTMRWAIGAGGLTEELVDRASGVDYSIQSPNSPCALVRRGDIEYPATKASVDGHRVVLEFGGAGVTAELEISANERYVVVEVSSISDEGVDEFVFLNVDLSLSGVADEPFVACALALNLLTNVTELPKPTGKLRASCYPRFGFARAKVAIIGCAITDMREVMQEVVLSSDDIPTSPIGGPWALDSESNRGSYLFNFGDMSIDAVDDWINLADSVGFNQIDFHGGNSFRMGDCLPNPETYPEGMDSFKTVIDRLHDAGISAGLHTYAFFLDKKCRWVTPIPHLGLGKDAEFTLAETLVNDNTEVLVEESTEAMSSITGFFVRNSVTLQIDNELIVYSGVDRDPPFAFTACERGACGTEVVPHQAGAKVHHLKECFGYFTPGGDSDLLSEVAAKSAEMFNYCGFDMMYLDALDGEDILGGPENGWHYGSKFVFELWKGLKKPSMMEMSTFHHHLWYVRSRLGAWDRPARSYKRFIDVHNAANDQYRQMFMPAHLGWWGVNTWAGHEGEPTMTDDVEYLCGTAIGTDTGLSLMGIDPSNIGEEPVMERLAAIIKRYEDVRHAGTVPESVKKQLREPGREFVLADDGSSVFCPVERSKFKVLSLSNGQNRWHISNPYGPQPVSVRIEALMSAAPYDSAEAIEVTDFADSSRFSDREFGPGMSAEIASSADIVKIGAQSGCFSAQNVNRPGDGQSAQDQYSLTEHGIRASEGSAESWAKLGILSDPPLDLGGHEAFGFWIYGDGAGEVLNLQLRCPSHMIGGIGDHYIAINFEGWRYVELIEPEGQRVDEYQWPYSGNAYAIYREGISYDKIESFSLWYNDISPGASVVNYLSPIRALPLVSHTLKKPVITIGYTDFSFDTDIESGQYLEFDGRDQCILYGKSSEKIAEVNVEGAQPIATGIHNVTFSCDADAEINPRARVMLSTVGPPLD